MSSCEKCPDKESCASAGQEQCPEDTRQPDEIVKEAPHQLAQIRRVVGICSGKGGVGKSLVTALTAVSLAKQGLTVGILDADITGPSIPKAFGLSGRLSGTDDGIFPAQTHLGIQIVSINLMLESQDAPVVWRGPILGGVVKQFWTDVIWDGLDVLLIDMPPGTGDVPLTVFQSIPLDGLIMVTTPQDLVGMIVRKAHNMAQMMHVAVLGLVENMSYLQCPGCDEQIRLFGEGQTAEAAQAMHLPLLDQMPIDPQLAALVDKGKIEAYEPELLEKTVAAINRVIAGGKA
ncbi:MAG: Mrp/NBP35 family ATP-binding protein [Ruminococcaceae bacterium]|jgi:Mrp family chromosome partitioning ATPase|nr:Mrp/NBP35 family ATP-binding protein [Oscillospiraceae bacterium]